MGFEDKRHNRQRPSAEFSDIGKGRRPKAEPAKSTRSKEDRVHNVIGDVHFETRHRPPNVDSYFFDADENTERSRVVQLEERERPQRRKNIAEPKKKPPSKNRNKGAPPQKQKRKSIEERGRQNNKQVAKTSKTRKPKRKMKPGLKKALRVIVTIFALVTILLVFIFLVFKVDIVQVTGESVYSSEEITEASGISKGGNLILLSSRAAQEKIIQKLPYIESIKINRKLPGTIEIAVTPLKVAVSIQQEKSWVHANSSGRIAEISTTLPTDTIQIVGLTLENPTVGNLIEIADDAQQTVYQEVFQTLTNADVLNSCKSIDFADLYNISLNYEDRVTIKLGSATELPDKLDFALGLIRDQIAADEKGTLDVSSAKENGRGIFTKDVQENALPVAENNTETDETQDASSDNPNEEVPENPEDSSEASSPTEDNEQTSENSSDEENWGEAATDFEE
ncbi:cell division protein FtsQ/DivIB [Scatolibacter rhodanostii]|uniref:cell division protein FtsQ/DivIB n=1 Tax=Scatolibacter rhodanostii TaxID=2014781 RepID=UPI000C06D24C|nr:FtsQ-type POTRA domain-containing protein [Scatolibacter rhodanostii]